MQTHMKTLLDRRLNLIMESGQAERRAQSAIAEARRLELAICVKVRDEMGEKDWNKGASVNFICDGERYLINTSGPCLHQLNANAIPDTTDMIVEHDG